MSVDGSGVVLRARRTLADVALLVYRRGGASVRVGPVQLNAGRERRVPIPA